MKQFSVGFGVAVVFVAYSLWVRHEQPVLAKPPSVIAATSTSQLATPSQPSQQPTVSKAVNGTYRDGSYAGSVEDAYYGNVQISAAITGGKLADVIFLQYPNTHSDSVMINQQAMPWLKQEAVQKQNANVDIISGATFTSEAFVRSLTNALSKAKAA